MMAAHWYQDVGTKTLALFMFFNALLSPLINADVVAVVSRCDNSSNPIPYIVAGDALELCCELKEVKCAETSMNDSLTLTPGDSYTGTMTRVQPCHVKYTKENASLADQGRYSCKWNNWTVNNVEVHVVERPKPKIVDIVCSPQLNINLTIDMGHTLSNWSYKVQVLMMESSKNETLCSNDTENSILNVNSTTLICQYRPDYRSPADNTLPIVIKVNISNVFTGETSAGSYNMIHYIRPDAMMALSLVDVNITHANITFKVSQHTNDVMSYMEKKHPLFYHVRILKTQGISEELQFSFPSSSKNVKLYPQVNIQLQNLTANTMYTFIVSGSGGGGEGPKICFTFSTAKSVPTQPPTIDSFLYTRAHRSNETELDSTLLLMWQPLSHEARSGNNLSYWVELTDGLGFLWRQTSIQEFFVHIERVPRGLLTAKVWAYNEIGQSTNFSAIQIPASDGTDKPTLIVEYQNRRLYAYVNFSAAASMTYQQEGRLLWCQGYEKFEANQIDICRDYPQFIERPVTTGIDGMWREELLMEEALPHPQVTENRTVNVMETGGRGNVSYNISVTVKLHVDYPENDRVDEQQCSKSVSKQLQEVQSLHTGTAVQAASVVATIPAQSVLTEPRYLRAFLSLQQNQGHSMVMLPSACYFNRASDEVQLTVWLCNNGQNKEKTHICFRQKCDSGAAKQYLVDYYDVFVSQDSSCKVAQKVGTIKNPIFSDAMMEVPKSATFACVLAYRSKSDDLSMLYKSFTQALVSPDEKNSPADTKALIIGITVPAVIVVFIISIVLWQCCRKKQNKFSKLEAVSRIVTEKEQKCDVESGHRPALPHDNEPTNPMSSVSTISNNLDSGRGTDEDSGGHTNEGFDLSSPHQSQSVWPNDDHSHAAGDIGQENAVSLQQLYSSTEESSGERPALTEEKNGTDDSDNEQRKVLGQMGFDLNINASTDSCEDERQAPVTSEGVSKPLRCQHLEPVQTNSSGCDTDETNVSEVSHGDQFSSSTSTHIVDNLHPKIVSGRVSLSDSDSDSSDTSKPLLL